MSLKQRLGGFVKTCKAKNPRHKSGVFFNLKLRDSRGNQNTVK